MGFTLGEKAGRVIKFLVGMRNPKVATALARHGFQKKDMNEGWALLNGLGAGKLAVFPIGPRDMEALQELDAWENQWFPIASASLMRHHPAVHARFFLNLSQAEGLEVAITVKTFVDRFEALSNPASPYGAEGAPAQTVLVARGITPQVINQAKHLLDTLASVETPDFSMEEQEDELSRAEAALWAWYLEWSQVARVAIKQRPLLRQLGFLNTRRTESGEVEEVEVPIEPAPVAAPQPASTVSTEPFIR